MEKIGILHGMEESFPPALAARTNELIAERGVPNLCAEPLKVGGVKLAEPSGYRIIIDRISHDIPFYRSYLKNAVLSGTHVINNPFWCSADDKFFNYALAGKLDVAVPPTVLLPHKAHPPGTTDRSMRNLEYPLDWEGMFRYIGFPAFLKPYNGGGWRDVYKVNTPEELFSAYDQTRDLCMVLQSAVEFDDYYRCYVVGQEKVHVMRYDPRKPHHLRYVEGHAEAGPLHERMVRDALKLCRALGYDLNTVEFACEGGVPYAIDFMNPAPDAALESVGPENFRWIVNAVAELAIARAGKPQSLGSELRWARFLS